MATFYRANRRFRASRGEDTDVNGGGCVVPKRDSGEGGCVDPGLTSGATRGAAMQLRLQLRKTPGKHLPT